MSNLYKKILLINNNSINSSNATGITLRSIFSAYPVENLIEINFSEKCIEENKFVKVSLPGRHNKNIVSILTKSKIFMSLNDKSKKTSLSPNQYSSNNKLSRMRISIISFFDIIPFRLPTKTMQTVISIKPDCIYTLGSSIATIKLSIELSKKFNIPIIFHFMDNWQDTLYTNTYFKLGRRKLMKSLCEAYNLTTINLVISEKMSDIYTSKWGKTHYTLMNVPSNAQRSFTVNNTDTINIVYAGGLHLDRWKGLLEIQEAIKNVFKQCQKKVKLTIFTKQEFIEAYSTYFDTDISVFNQFVDHSEINKIYSAADILVHVESFNSELMVFTMYSISTKISEYMYSGRPIVLYSPSSLAVYDLIEKTNAGIACDTPQKLENALLKLVDDSELRIFLGSNGIKYAEENYSIENKQKILDILFKNRELIDE